MADLLRGTREDARRAAFLECAEIAERDSDNWYRVGQKANNDREIARAFARSDGLRALAARYRQMAEGSGE